MDNRNNNPLPDAVVADALKKIDELRDLLAPFITILLVKEREELPKMGDKTIAFVSKTAELSVANKPLLPAYLDIDGLQLDAHTNAALMPIFQGLKALTYDIESTRMLAGSEGYAVALMAYAAFQAAARAKQPAAQAACDELRARFEGQGKAKPKPAKPTE